MDPLKKKTSGSYYTPDAVASMLVRWAVRTRGDRMLDPSCGDGRFITLHRNSVGIEQDAVAAHVAMERAPGSLVHEGDFFAWVTNTAERFDCAVGNPPFIRYQTFKGQTRERALALCDGLGAAFSGLASSWAPFLVAAASVLLPGGRMAFVVPAEIGHAPYAAPLLEYLVAHFATVHVIAIMPIRLTHTGRKCPNM
jgi:adenine-specific DNA methylase